LLTIQSLLSGFNSAFVGAGVTVPCIVVCVLVHLSLQWVILEDMQVAYLSHVTNVLPTYNKH